MQSAKTKSDVRDRGNISRFELQPILRTASKLASLGVLALLAALLLTAAQPAQAQTESVLHSFTGADGSGPLAGVVLDTKGNLYGTTNRGGASGVGTVFKVTPAGVETVLHSFVYDGTDGLYPYASGVVRDKLGNLYGTTYEGGVFGQGTVFKVTPAGVETVLHGFAQDGTDGNVPYAGLVLDTKGNLYGTTYLGGASGYGTVFKVTPAGVETVLHTFTGGTDGCAPYGAGVILGKKGTLYGTTSGCGANGYGTVFKVTASGAETVLYSFGNVGMDGDQPYAGVVLDKLGNLYGTTNSGGAGGGGTVFKVTPAGVETVLHSFANNGTDGYAPWAGVVLDKLGNLYGTTAYGGAMGGGTVFKVTPAGVETVLHSFANNGTDGYYPYFSGVVLDKKGNLYGITYLGGANGFGTVFKVTP